MAGETRKSKDYLKLLYLNGLYKHTINPVYALASRASIEEDGIKISTEESGAVLPDKSVISIERISEQAKLTPAPKNKSEVASLEIKIDGKRYTFNDRLVDDVKDFFVGDDKGIFDKVIAKLSLWDMLVIDAALFEARAPLYVIEMQQLDELNAKGEDEKALLLWKTKNENFLQEIKKVVFESYILPTIRQLQQPKRQQTVNPEDHSAADAFSSAAAVFSACESQLRADNVPEELKPLVYQLVDETAKGLAGHYNHQRYLQLVRSLPLEYSAFRIISGAALMFAGAMVALLGVALLVPTGGVSGIAISAGIALFATSGLFASSKVESDIAEKAEAFHAHQIARMGG